MASSLALKPLGVVAILALGIVPLPADVRALLLLLAAAVLWATEAVPAYATALAVSAAIAVGGLMDYRDVLSLFFSPTIALLFGGLVLGKGLEASGAAEYIAERLLRVAGSSFTRLIIVYMILVYVLSMWMSNTAATAIALALVYPVFRRLPGPIASRAAPACLLAIAYASTAGGMATLIGTPPNAVAVGFLEALGAARLGFSDWFLIGFPVSLTVMLFLLTYVRLALRSCRLVAAERIEPRLVEALRARSSLAKIDARIAYSLLVLLIAALLWATDKLTGLHPALTSLLAAALLAAAGIVGRKEVAEIGWDTLLLFAGGLVLGKALAATGAAEEVSKALTMVFASPLAGIAMLLALTTLLTAFASNTATTALVAPIAYSYSIGLGLNPVPVVIAVALAASNAYLLPVSTPPNALVYSTGLVRIRDMARTGLPVAIVHYAIVFAYAISAVPATLHG